MTPERHLTWESFEALIRAGKPARFGVEGTPAVDLFVDADGSRIGLRSPVTEKGGISPSTLKSVDIKLVEIEGTVYAEVSTAFRRLYQVFHSFLLGVADSIQLKKANPLVAIREQVKAWAMLLQRAAKLSKEEETGLWGELWFLEQLIRRHGSVALDAWIGPLGEPHDFRIDSKEFEVKTTKNAERVHIINGIHQLVPSANRTLHLVSVQIEPAGASGGNTLPGRVSRIRCLLEADQYKLASFSSILQERFGLDESDSALYTDSFQLRSQVFLVPVGDAFPKITPKSLEEAVGPGGAQRIRNVQYRVDVAGLGYAMDPPEFEKLICDEGVS